MYHNLVYSTSATLTSGIAQSSVTSIVLCVSGFTLPLLLFTFTTCGLDSISIVLYDYSVQNQIAGIGARWLVKDAGTQRGRLAIAKCLRLALRGELECRGSLTFGIRRYVSFRCQ